MLKLGAEAPPHLLQFLERRSYPLQTSSDARNLSTLFYHLAKHQEHCVDALARVINNDALTFLDLADDKAITGALEGFLILDEQCPDLMVAVKNTLDEGEHGRVAKVQAGCFKR